MGSFFNTIRSIFNKSGREHKPPAVEVPVRLQTQVDLNLNRIRSDFGNSSDIVTFDIRLHRFGSAGIGVVYLLGMADIKIVQEMIKDPILKLNNSPDPEVGNRPKDMLEIVKQHVPALSNAKPVDTYSALYSILLSGDTVILLDGFPYGLTANSAGGKQRSVEEPATQTVVRGPREGFTESLMTNISLIRRRIKSPDLWVENMTIGRITQTTVGLIYLNGIVNEMLVTEARERLTRIDIDGIIESGNIEELIQDETFTPFPTLFNTERPDVVASGLLEGRIAIIVDGTPFVLLAPALFVQFYQSAEDYYQRAEFATLIRMLRYICFFISLLAPSLYIAITTFHQELLPSTLLFSLAAQREGIPFPAFVEAIIMEVTFEILREAGVRLPRTVGQAVSIVGALVIGQAAVEAGLVSAAMVIVVAITAISNFVIPSFNMGISVRIIRFLLMVFAATFGLFGVTVGLIAMVQHLCSLRSFGVPYMSPMAPFIVADQKDTILRFPQWGLFARPRFISQKNVIRENNAPTAKPERNRL